MSIFDADRAELPPAAWNRTAAPFRRGARIDDLVLEASRIDPNAVALLSEMAEFSHGDLDRHSGQIAALLQRWGVRRGDVVGLYCARSPQAVIGLVGALRAGAAYVPLDIRWPRARVRDLLARLEVSVVLTDLARLRALDEIRPGLPALTDLLCLDVETAHPWQAALDPEAVRELWDAVASAPDPLEAAGFNTGRPGALRHEWRDAVAYRDHVSLLARNLAGAGARVLEVGCGSGLVLEAMAGWAGELVAVDPSPVAVERVAEWAAAEAPHVRAAIAYAHDLAGIAAGPVDVAVLASVTQFFPDADYLTSALEEVARAVRPGGAMLVADVPHPERSEHAGLRTAPAFFERLAAESGLFSAVEIRGRDGVELPGELRERYDVVLRVAAAPAAGRRQRVHTWRDAIAVEVAEVVEPGHTADDLAYIIFTSGSTGSPNGVEVEHRSAVNLIEWVNRTFAVSASDRLLFVTSFAFDLSVYDMFGILAAGGSIRIASDSDVVEPERLVELLERDRITFWDSAPAALSVVLPFLDLRPPRGGDLRLVFQSGDWVPLSTPDAIRRHFPGARVVALGGATECTVWSNWFDVKTVDPAWPSIPYGRPMQNARYHVLDRDLAPCPIGAAGDLYIAGECVARAYARNPQLTAGKFVPDPWPVDAGDRMYRTGDRARWLASGEMQFLGRLDDQVKISGYRVELGEVQTALARCPAVAEAVVLAAPGPDGPQLAGFFRPHAPITAAEIRRELGRALPAYLVPSRLVEVASFPLSPNGKVDRAALVASLEAASVAVERREPAAPGSLEAVVAEAWRRVLGRAPASPSSSFFASGGTSLAAARLAALLRERTGRAVTARDVFERPDLEQLAALLRGPAGAGVAP